MASRYENYLVWLGNQIEPDRDQEMYAELFEILQVKEFVWLIPNDDNRVEDGLDIRAEFFHRHNALKQGCSVLEVILGLSRRMAFAAGGHSEQWAWQLITNLDLNIMYGYIGDIRREWINEILERFIWRNYRPDGTLGLFPLARPNGDQRKVELWYQMCAYIEELPDE